MKPLVTTRVSHETAIDTNVIYKTITHHTCHVSAMKPPKTQTLFVKPLVTTRVIHETAPQWRAADAEIKVPSVENTELKRSPLKPGVGQYIAVHATLTAREFFLAYFYPSGPFICIFSKPSPDFFVPV